ncbi:Butyrate kinase 2 [Sporomusa silvacetica DSM 10669]|uniref:Probable butyrate kinase n=1 Tax=Sporomusa silvacetica DSM 10669 TaxID=1123289 RepID=A0ABZ3IU87_9FIRM|nr:butyrate kinase [Sporomusa silvacetica]OZC22318.1 butyrate kinase 2 [Sporomusa silvacetica DSM 10669]
MSEIIYKILSINPGSTSTKIAVYENEKELFRKTVLHNVAQLSSYESMVDQLQMRKEAIMNCLKEEGFLVEELSAVAGRGGKLPPLKQGAYKVDNEMVDFLTYRPIDDHASNLGAILAYEIANATNIPSYIYDAVVVDELEDIARLSGVPELTRRASCHVLNMRAVALKTAKKLNRNFRDTNFVVSHMGGGITATVISGGRMIDVLTDEEGPFSPERAGRVPCRQLVDLCFSGKHDRLSATKRMRGQGGLVAYLGTNNALEVEAKIKNGDKYAELVYQGMAYQVAKGIGEMATVVKGKVDCIILTGAVAYSSLMTEWIVERIGFIAPVEIVAGENELEALAYGVLRVLRGEEQAHMFIAP